MAAARKKSAPKKKPPSRSGRTPRASRLGVTVAVWIGALGLTAAALVAVLLLPQHRERPVVPPQQNVAAKTSQRQQHVDPPARRSPPAQEYPRFSEQAPEQADVQAPAATPATKPPPVAAQTQPEGEGAGPRLALVIDDMGRSLHTARTLWDIFGPSVTWSILPYSIHTREVVAFAREHGMEFLLHLPMEPQGYPQVDPGPGSLFVDMDADQIRAILTRDLARVPGAVGANNHMGSRFTADEQDMEVVLREIKSHRLFFMDSLTSPRSTVKAAARSLQVPLVRRDVFLDNKQDVQAIVAQLQHAEYVAAKAGQAVAICHPHPETLTALSKWSKERDTGIKLVRLSDLVPVEPLSLSSGGTP